MKDKTHSDKPRFPDFEANIRSRRYARRGLIPRTGPPPSALELATLAATLARSSAEEIQEKLCASALNLWHVAQETIALQSQCNADWQQRAEWLKAEQAKLPEPPESQTWPMTLDAFCKIILPGLDTGDHANVIKAWLSMSQICDPRSYHTPKLRFAAVNLGTELDTIAIDESANFKTIVSGEPIEARPIYGEPFTMQTACKLWFLANGLPRFKNGTDAELRRTRFLRFDRVPAVKDVSLKSRLLAERDGVFRFMLAGLQRLLTLPEIPLGGAESQAVHVRFKVSNDPLGCFVATHCDLDPAGTESKESIKNAFTEFCETHGLPVEFSAWFFKRLYERFTSLREVEPRREGSRVKCIAGLRLKNHV